MNTPILLLVYKKPETTKKVIDAIRLSKAKKIYISINTPKKKNIEDLKKNRKVIEIINMIKVNKLQIELQIELNKNVTIRNELRVFN